MTNGRWDQIPERYRYKRRDGDAFCWVLGCGAPRPGDIARTNKARNNRHASPHIGVGAWFLAKRNIFLISHILTQLTHASKTVKAQRRPNIYMDLCGGKTPRFSFAEVASVSKYNPPIFYYLGLKTPPSSNSRH